MFVGDELEAVLESIEEGTIYQGKKKVQMKIGVDVLPKFPKDTTDRNRTSPFAFTGNKFEFRMLGSSESIACANIMLNTAVAEELCEFADILESSQRFEEDLNELIRSTIKSHKRIIFNGNGYDEAWIKEAEKRGLLNLKTTPDCLPYYISKKNIELFKKHEVLSETEVYARYEIIIENYAKLINIEALTMIDMVKKMILPAVTKYSDALAKTIIAKQQVSSSIVSTYECSVVREIAELSAKLYEDTKSLESLDAKAKKIEDAQKSASYYKDYVIPQMEKVRESADKLEVITAKEYWPFPSYSEILFSV